MIFANATGFNALLAGSAITAFLGAGDDTAVIPTGTNYIDGGVDNDLLFGGEQGDTLIGGEGIDTLYGDPVDLSTRAFISVAGGNDLLFGGAGNDVVSGGGGSDLVIGGSGDDQLRGSWDNDLLWGGGGNDILLGESGDDQLFDDLGDDSLNGGDGNDLLSGGAGNDILNGDAGGDTLIAGAGVDYLGGGDGNDVLIDSSVGSATLNGGNDNDIYIITNSRTLVREFVGEGANDIAYVYVNNWVPTSNIERIIYMNGATPPSAAVLALHGTDLRPEPGTTSVFRYAFVDAPYEQSKTGSILPFTGSFLPGGQSLQMVAVDQAFRQAFRQAANEFERIANIRFVEVSTPAQADFAVGSHNMTLDGYAQRGVGPDSKVVAPLMINSAIPTAALQFGQISHSLLVHELGHIIGLKHPFSGDFQLPGEDVGNGRFSLMSYGEGRSDEGLMIFDIEAVRFIYGTRTTATGDDVYRLDRGNFWYPGLVDDGGIDTIDASPSQAGATIDLTPGSFSSINLVPRNLGIANGTIIENVIGTAFSDLITGNAANNRLEGRAGNDILVGGPSNDIIDGGAGIDTAVINDTGAVITVTRGANRLITISSATDGTDTLFNIEFVRVGGIDYRLSQFTQTNAPRLDNFTIGAGWTSQDRFTRHVADINGDGYADIIGFGQTGTLAVLGSANGGFGPLFEAITDFAVNQGWTSDNLFHRALADVNGDGRDDIIGFGVAGVLVALAQAEGRFGAPALASTNFNPANGWTSQNSFARTLADVNGDGFADIIGFGVPGTFVALGSGTGMFGEARLALANFGANQGWTSDNIFHRELGDVNGDGRADIVGFGADGTLVALGQADGTFAAPLFALNDFGLSQGWSTQDALTRDLADVDGDGRADIVGFGLAGTFVANGLANGSFSAAALELANFGQNQGWVSNNRFPRELADVNGDGRADIVGFGQNGVFAAIAFDGQVI